MTDLVTRARELAYRAHAGQVDKAGRPYIEHVARVAAAVSDDPESEAVAWLHDVVEDRPGFRSDVATFPWSIHLAVLLLTRDLVKTAEHYYRDISCYPITLRVKLADIADNMDPVRLALLDPKTAKRLQAKYVKALSALTA